MNIIWQRMGEVIEAAKVEAAKVEAAKVEAAKVAAPGFVCTGYDMDEDLYIFEQT